MRTLAVFDFDNTLTLGDTLLPWLMQVCGRPATLRAAAWASLTYPFLPSQHGRRTAFKHRLQAGLLRGISQDHAARAATSLAVPWHPQGLAALAGHRRAGHDILIATGAADILIRPLMAQTFGLEKIIATRLTVQDGLLTGDMDGPNCVRAAKAELVSAWLAAHGPFAQTYGYGNAPHDLPFLSLMDHAHLVNRRGIRRARVTDFDHATPQ